MNPSFIKNVADMNTHRYFINTDRNALIFINKLIYNMLDDCIFML